MTKTGRPRLPVGPRRIVTTRFQAKWFA